MFQGAFQKDDTKGYPNPKLPQHYKKKFMENPNLECLYLVINVEKTD